MGDTTIPYGKGVAATPSDAAILADAEAEAISGGGLYEIWEAAKMIIGGSARGDFFGVDKARDFLNQKPSALPTGQTEHKP